MRLFKSIDDKLADIGFAKTDESKYIVAYERKNKQFGDVQIVEIMHKKNGHHLVFSYDKNLMDIKKIGNTCVGLSFREMKLFSKKINNLKKDKNWR